MKKINLFVAIICLAFIVKNGMAQNSELGYRATEINLAKQQSAQRFISSPLPLILEPEGTFIYSSFSKTALNGDFVNYSDNENYTKTISSQGAGDKLNLRFYYFSTEANADFLYIYDGPDTNSPLLATLSGNLANNTSFKSSGNAITLKFVSNGTVTDKGFKLYAHAEGPFVANELALRNTLSCNSVPATDECFQAPQVCNFNSYCGTTSAAYTAGATTGVSNSFCGSIENNSWLSFTAASPSVSFIVTSANCQDNASGIQVAIYDTPDCVANYTMVTNCESQSSGPGTFTITNNIPLQIGKVYYMMIDGYAGNVCSYTITAAPGTAGGINISSPYSEICPGYTTTLTSSVLSNNYIWTDGFGNTYADQQSIVVSPTVTTTYSLHTDPNSCGVSDAVRTISVSTILSTPVIGSSSVICSGLTATLTTNAVGYNYTWTGPNGFQSSLQNPVIPNFTNANDGTYSLNINIDAGCAANEATKTLTVSPTPTPGLIASSSSICNFSPVPSLTLTASGSNAVSGYTWNWNMFEASITVQSCIQIPIIGSSCTDNSVFSSIPQQPGAGPKAVFKPNMPTTVCVVATSSVGCVSTSTCISITESSTAITQITGNTYICRGDSSLIALTGTAPFTWTFPVNNGTLSVSPNKDSVWVKPVRPVTYTVKAVDGSSCTATRNIVMNIDTLCTWPGDTDRDGVVTQNDLLPIGIYYGANGSSRPNASLSWEGQYCTSWTQIQAGGVNMKHIDANGDGTITAADTLAIYQNIGLTHALKTANTNIVNPEVFITFHKPIYNEGDTVIAYLYLGDNTAQLNNFYGAAFKLSFDDAMIQANTAKFNFTNSWVGTPLQDVVMFNYLHAPSQQFLEAFVRNTHSNVSGYGKIAEAKFLLNTALTSTVFTVWFTDGVKTSNDYNVDPLASVTATVPINVNIATGVSKVDQGTFQIYPNPTTGLLTVHSNYMLQKVEVTNVTGQVLLLEAATEKTHQLQLQNFTAGIYFVKVTGTNGMSTIKKIVKQ